MNPMRAAGYIVLIATALPLSVCMAAFVRRVITTGSDDPPIPTPVLRRISRLMYVYTVLLWFNLWILAR